MSVEHLLPEAGERACLVGRVWINGIGPSPVVIAAGDVVDISRRFATVSALLDVPNSVAAARDAAGDGALLGQIDERGQGWDFIAPCDLQAVKAAGVTFATSLLERVVEEQARGDPSRADHFRAEITSTIGSDLRGLKPGSPAAMALKEVLVQRGLWSQYLEVGIGPDAEIFTKCQPMAAVGPEAKIGVHPASSWNNPEPEVVLALNSRGDIVGATLGNDVNLRDVEGRSALLLGRAKDNNASCAVGPFIRLLDENFTLDHLRATVVNLAVRDADGSTVLEGRSSLSEISRDIADLAGQLVSDHHQYPDGAMLFTGTMFAPIKDRDQLGGGFTHHIGDVVEIASPALGQLVNTVERTDAAPPWRFGTRALMENLADRGLIGKEQRS